MDGTIRGCMAHLAACTCFVPRRVDGDVSTQMAVTKRLQALGSKVAGRLSAACTHVVFLAKLLPTPDEQRQQDTLLKDLHDHLSKVGTVSIGAGGCHLAHLHAHQV